MRRRFVAMPRKPNDVPGQSFVTARCWGQVQTTGNARPYIVHFLCIEAMLMIELDRGQHGETSDATRSAWLAAKGYAILQFWNHEVLTNLDDVADVVAL